MVFPMYLFYALTDTLAIFHVPSVVIHKIDHMRFHGSQVHQDIH